MQFDFLYVCHTCHGYTENPIGSCPWCGEKLYAIRPAHQHQIYLRTYSPFNETTSINVHEPDDDDDGFLLGSQDMDDFLLGPNGRPIESHSHLPIIPVTPMPRVAPKKKRDPAEDWI